MKFGVGAQGDSRDVKFPAWILFVQDQAFPSDTLLSSADMTTQFKTMKCVCVREDRVGAA